MLVPIRAGDWPLQHIRRSSLDVQKGLAYSRPGLRCLVQEVYLLKRHPDSMLVEDAWHAEGPFDGNTLSMPPVWPGAWLIDVLVCIHDCEDGRNFWLKAMHRNVSAAASPESAT